MLGFSIPSVKDILTAPIKAVGYLYHKTFSFLLSDSTIGLVNFVNEGLKPTVLAVSNLHDRSAAGEEISETEWVSLSEKSTQAVTDNVTDAASDPIGRILQTSTKSNKDPASINIAVETLVMIITMFCSKSAPGAAADTISSLVPGGKITQEVVRNLIFDRIKKLVV